MNVLDEICDLLQTHPNRDKVVSLFSYILKVWGAKTENKTLLVASGRLAVARSTLRMFDSPSALKTAIKYGLGTHEGPLWGSLGSAGCMSVLAYLTAEKLVFLLDIGAVKLSEQDELNIRISHKLFWSISAAIGLIRSLRGLHTTCQEMKSRDRRKCAPDRFVQASLTTTKLVLDVIHSVSWLPNGWLWGSKLSVPQAGSVASVSAVLAIVIHYHGKRFNK